MKEAENFVVLGGDVRQISVANILAEKGFGVKAYGFGNTEGFSPKVHIAKSLDSSLFGAEAIILPLPCSTDDETLNLLGFKEPIKLFELFRKIPQDSIVLGGRITEKVFGIAALYQKILVDYFDREELEILNAVPTAEGALQIAMEETATTISGSNCLVLGHGRISKVLSRLLAGMNARVTVAARKQQDLAWIRVRGYQDVHIYHMEESLKKADIIFNTVPSMILNEKELKLLNKNTLVIDLASKPGGAGV